MVIIRINSDDPENHKKINDDYADIRTKLKLCKLMPTDIDEKTDLSQKKTENKVQKSNSNSNYEHTIFRFSKNQKTRF
jgi:hypothetical protein